MSWTLELSNWEFQTVMNNMLRDLRDNVDIMQEQIGNVNREMEILIKKQKGMLDIKNRITEMKMPLMDTAEENL